MHPIKLILWENIPFSLKNDLEIVSGITTIINFRVKAILLFKIESFFLEMYDLKIKKLKQTKLF